MITIKLISSSTGNPIKGKRVRIGFDGFARGMSDIDNSDSDGEVHYNHDPGTGKVFVDGKSVYDGKIQGKVIIYL